MRCIPAPLGLGTLGPYSLPTNGPFCVGHFVFIIIHPSDPSPRRFLDYFGEAHIIKRGKFYILALANFYVFYFFLLYSQFWEGAAPYAPPSGDGVALRFIHLIIRIQSFINLNRCGKSFCCLKVALFYTMSIHLLIISYNMLKKSIASLQ